MSFSLLAIILLALFSTMQATAGCSPSPLQQRLNSIPKLGWTLQARLPHDSNAFTQGFLFRDGKFYESTGRYGASSLREVEVFSGNILRLHSLPAHLFGEGLCLVGNRLVQLTWKAKTAFIYDLATFKILGQHRYDTEGWGLTAAKGQIFMSDGSSLLTVRDAESFQILKIIHVHDGQGPIAYLNELEYVEDALLANVWKEDVILKISPEDGAVRGYIDLEGLPWPDRPCKATEEVANGIAFDESTGLLYVTGKFWPYVFVLKVNFNP